MKRLTLTVLAAASVLTVLTAPAQAAPPSPPSCWTNPVTCISSPPTPPGRSR